MGTSARNIALYIVSLIVLIGGAWLFASPAQQPGRIIGPFDEQGGGRPTPVATAKPEKIQIKLSPVEDSTSPQSGTVTLEDMFGMLRVSIALTDTAGISGPQPAHIHMGSCPGVGNVAYPLNDVVNGRSETIINLTTDQLKNQLPLAVNVHKSDTEVTDYTACGDLTK